MQQVRRDAEQALLLALRDSSDPIGARQGRVALLAAGFTISEATVSRMLRDFDTRNWTAPVGSKGRILTASGRDRADQVLDGDEGTANVERAIDVHTAQDLVDLLAARRAVERETARLAAVHATAEDVARLRELVARHAECLAQNQPARSASLAFHRQIAALAPNRIIHAMSELILARRLERLESVLDLIIPSPEADAHVVDEHYALVDAIEAGDHLEAERLMGEHLQRLVNEVERYVTGGPTDLVTRLIEWLNTHSRAEPEHGPVEA